MSMKQQFINIESELYKVPFRVTCTNDIVEEIIGGKKKIVGKVKFIGKGKTYKVEEIKKIQLGELWRVGKGYYNPTRFIIL